MYWQPVELYDEHSAVPSAGLSILFAGPGLVEVDLLKELLDLDSAIRFTD